MDNNALLAALGMDAVTAVRGYRAAVVAEAARRRLDLGGGALPGPVWSRITDPMEIRIAFGEIARADVAGRLLGWSAATGWWLCCPSSPDRVRFFAGPKDHPLHLVPTPPDVVDWATAGPHSLARCAESPAGIDLEGDPAALHRLIAFIDPHRQRHAGRAIRTPPRRPSAPTGSRRP